MFIEPISIPRALNTGTCIQQGDLFYSAGQHRKKLGEVLEKMQVNGKTRDRFWTNAGEWIGRVEISKEEIPGSKRSVHGNILTYARLYRENL